MTNLFKTGFLLSLVGLFGCVGAYSPDDNRIDPVVDCFSSLSEFTMRFTFDGIGMAPEMRLTDHGVLVYDSCDPSVGADVQPYVMRFVPRSHDRFIGMWVYSSNPLPTDVDFSLYVATTCSSPFNLAGSAQDSVVGRIQKQNGPDCFDVTSTVNDRITFQ